MAEQISGEKLFELHLGENEVFTEAQNRVIKLVLEGKSNKQIREDLGLSERALINLLYGVDYTSCTKSDLGIFGILETKTGRRPDRTGIIMGVYELGLLVLKRSGETDNILV